MKIFSKIFLFVFLANIIFPVLTFTNEKINIGLTSENSIKKEIVEKTFKLIFPNYDITIHSYSVASDIAEQPIGEVFGIESVYNRLKNVKNVDLNEQDYWVSIASYIEENNGIWRDRAVVLVQKNGHLPVLEFTEATEIDSKFVEKAKMESKRDYEFSNSGLSKTVGRVIREEFEKRDDQIAEDNWHEHEQFGGISRKFLLQKSLYHAIIKSETDFESDFPISETELTKTTILESTYGHEKIYIVGTGATASYITKALTAENGKSAVVISRTDYSKPIEEIKENPKVKNLTWYSVQKLPPHSLVFITTKNKDLRQVGEDLYPRLDGTQTLVFIQNGLGVLDESPLLKNYPNKIRGSLFFGIDIDEGILKVTGTPKIGLASNDTETLREISDIAKSSGLEVIQTEKISELEWSKAIHNLAFNGSTAIFEKNIGEILENNDLCQLSEKLLQESIKIANAEGINFTQEQIDSVFTTAKKMSSRSTSMRLDMQKKQPTENKWLYGYVLKKGKKYNIPTPAITYLYNTITLAEKNYKNIPNNKIPLLSGHPAYTLEDDYRAKLNLEKAYLKKFNSLDLSNWFPKLVIVNGKKLENPDSIENLIPFLAQLHLEIKNSETKIVTLQFDEKTFRLYRNPLGQGVAGIVYALFGTEELIKIPRPTFIGILSMMQEQERYPLLIALMEKENFRTPLIYEFNPGGLYGYKQQVIGETISQFLVKQEFIQLQNNEAGLRTATLYSGEINDKLQTPFSLKIKAEIENLVELRKKYPDLVSDLGPDNIMIGYEDLAKTKLKGVYLVDIGPSGELTRNRLNKVNSFEDYLEVAETLINRYLKTGGFKSEPTGEQAVNIGFYTGTFDPPHNGHKELMNAAIKELKLDLLYVFPNPLPLFRSSFQPYKHRLEMAKIAFKNKNIIVGIEGKDNIESKEIDSFIVNLIKKNDPNLKFFRVMGDDRFNHYIASNDFTHPNLTLVSFQRINETMSDIKVLGQSPVLCMPPLEKERGYSATDVRNKLKNGIKPLNVEDEVLLYIQENGLYLNEDNFIEDKAA